MATTINITVTRNGAAYCPDRVAFGSRDETYGVKERPGLSTVEANDTAFNAAGVGSYTYEITDPPAAVSYDYSLAVTDNNVTGFYPVSNRVIATTYEHNVSVPDFSYYTSEAEVLRMLGPYGTSLSLDDFNAEGTEQVWIDFLEDVNSTMDMYLNQFYDTSELLTNYWVRRRATILTAFAISNRRGNPTLFNQRAEMVYEELNGVRDNRFHVPKARPFGFRGPVVRNYTMQNVFKQNPVRVNANKSTGDAYSGERIAYLPFFW